IRALQKEADAVFRKNMEEAKKHFEAGRFGQAVTQSESALTFYPERKSDVRAFQDKVRQTQAETAMVRIPSTPCWIGNDDRLDEKPLRQVKLSPFLIDKYEVTNEDYYAFCAATGRPVPMHWAGNKPPPRRERHQIGRAHV